MHLTNWWHTIPIALALRPLFHQVLVDGLLERLGAGGGRVFSVAPADAAEAVSGCDTRLLDHLAWPCTLRSALLVRAVSCIHSEQLVFGGTPPPHLPVWRTCTKLL